MTLERWKALPSASYWGVPDTDRYLNDDANLDDLGKVVSSSFVHCKVIIFPPYLIFSLSLPYFFISHIRNSLCFACTSMYNLHLVSTVTSQQSFPRSLGFHGRLRCLTMRQRRASTIWTLSTASYRSPVQTSVSKKGNLLAHITVKANSEFVQELSNLWAQRTPLNLFLLSSLLLSVCCFILQSVSPCGLEYEWPRDLDSQPVNLAALWIKAFPFLDIHISV